MKKRYRKKNRKVKQKLTASLRGKMTFFDPGGKFLIMYLIPASTTTLDNHLTGFMDSTNSNHHSWWSRGWKLKNKKWKSKIKKLSGICWLLTLRMNVQLKTDVLCNMLSFVVQLTECCCATGRWKECVGWFYLVSGSFAPGWCLTQYSMVAYSLLTGSVHLNVLFLL